MRTLESSPAAALLDQARRLIDPAGGAEPHPIDVRRAVSAAYYAVYHELALRVASQLVGGPQAAVDPASTGAIHVTRWFTHGALLEACRLVRVLHRSSTDPSWRAKRRSAWHLLHEHDPAAPSEGLLETAERIAALRTLRNWADYDFAAVLDRGSAVAAIDSAAVAVETLRRHAHTATYRGFFVLVAMSARGELQV